VQEIAVWPRQGREEGRHLGGGRGDSAARNSIPGKRSTLRAIGITRQRIVDDRADGAEVARAHGCGGECLVRGSGELPPLRALVVHKEEQLVLAVDHFGDPDWSADSETIFG